MDLTSLEGRGACKAACWALDPDSFFGSLRRHHYQSQCMSAQSPETIYFRDTPTLRRLIFLPNLRRWDMCISRAVLRPAMRPELAPTCSQVVSAGAIPTRVDRRMCVSRDRVWTLRHARRAESCTSACWPLSVFTPTTVAALMSAALISIVAPLACCGIERASTCGGVNPWTNEWKTKSRSAY